MPGKEGFGQVGSAPEGIDHIDTFTLKLTPDVGGAVRICVHLRARILQLDNALDLTPFVP